MTCGSGCGTALACRRLGDDQVTSVDVDPYLIHAARERLAAAGHRPHLQVCDATGELPGVYDRIVSTVSVPTIPASWLGVLTTGGRLVTTLSGTGLLIVVDRTTDGGATSVIAPEHAAFMRTRQGDDCHAAPDNGELWATARKADGETVTTGRYPVMRVSSIWDVRSTLELTVPDIEHRTETAPDGSRTAYMLHPDGSWARARARARATAPGPGKYPPSTRAAPVGCGTNWTVSEPGSSSTVIYPWPAQRYASTRTVPGTSAAADGPQPSAHRRRCNRPAPSCAQHPPLALRPAASAGSEPVRPQPRGAGAGGVPGRGAGCCPGRTTAAGGGVAGSASPSPPASATQPHPPDQNMQAGRRSSAAATGHSPTVYGPLFPGVAHRGRHGLPQPSGRSHDRGDDMRPF
ncbi:hypothetical protein ACIBEA_16550 [Streptomyces sp. NPDC051555]|uniref:hypothetical protein n=1 Tax=Streptomyces sp. NPDC051555 TaxID=3365657 RepID=UPI00379499BC